MRFLRNLLVLAIAMVFCIAACVHRQPATGKKFIWGPKKMGNHVAGEVQVGLGIACYRDGMIGPPSYLATQIGQRGVQRLLPQDAIRLRKIMEHNDPKSLRFVYVRGGPYSFVVFDATVEQLCDPTHPPFIDVTGACNSYYEPYDVMYSTTSAMGCENKN